MATYADITGWGKCMPPAVLTNDDFASVIDTSDEWIRTRSGIAERRVSHVPNSDLAAVAAKRAMAAAGAEPEEIDLLILASTSGDNMVPSTGSYVQAKTDTLKAAVFDLNAGCSGFIYGLEVATSMIRAAGYRKALVIGSERLTWLINFSDRSSGVLFGDGAGAVVVEPSEEKCGLLSAHLGCDGRQAHILEVPNSGTGGDRFRENYNVFDINFDGREIFKRAVKGMAGEVNKVLKDTGVGKDDIDLVIPHQANLRIIESLAHFLRMPMEKVAVNIQNYGNTSAATIPVALCEMLEQGRIRPGDNIMMAAFGAGLTRGAGLLRWGQRVEPLGESDAELPPCDQTALEILGDAIKHTL
jgi:3-oxoacyl-[acyl-carrier-protein] synthase-3